MELWQDRVVIERAELAYRIERLRLFMGNPFFASLSEVDRTLLSDQLEAMEDYLGILDLRISFWSENET